MKLGVIFCPSFLQQVICDLFMMFITPVGRKPQEDGFFPIQGVVLSFCVIFDIISGLCYQWQQNQTGIVQHGT